MRTFLISVVFAMMGMVAEPAIAAEDLAITPQEHAACDADAVSLCGDVNHDEAA